MKRVLCVCALALGLGAKCAFAPAARAEQPAAARGVVVVDVDPVASGIDAARLRKAIGEELGTDAVAPGDARVSAARGTIAVSVDRAAGALVVSYREKAARIVRRIDLPPDKEATIRAAVMLAGNLARDEASELAAMLRRRPASAQASASAPPPASGSADPDLESDDDPRSARDLESMQRTLAWYTGHRRTLRTALGWSAVAAGVTLEAAGIYLSFERPGLGLNAVVTGTGFGVMLTALQAPPNGALDGLQTYYRRDLTSGRSASLVRDDLESRWLLAARFERRWRIISAWVGFVGVGLEALLFTLPGLVGGESMWEAGLAPLYIGYGVALLGPAVIAVSGPGSVESSLRSYERATGRTVWADHAAPVAPSLALLPGGGVLGLGGRF